VGVAAGTGGWCCNATGSRHSGAAGQSGERSSRRLLSVRAGLVAGPPTRTVAAGVLQYGTDRMLPVVTDRLKVAGLGGSSTWRPPVVAASRLAAGLTICVTSWRPPVVVACRVAAGLTNCFATRRPPILSQWPKAAGLMGTLPARWHQVPPGRRLAIGMKATATVTTGLLFSLILAPRRHPQVAAGRSAPLQQVLSPGAVRVVRF